MDRLEILKYIYAVDNYSGEIKRVYVEEYSYMRKYTLVFVKDVGLVTFHGGKVSEKNGVTYYLSSQYLIQFHFATTNKRIEEKERQRDYHYKEWRDAIKRIEELQSSVVTKEDLVILAKEDKERIGLYHRMKGEYQKEIKPRKPRVEGWFDDGMEEEDGS